jgi:hypothetical protein
MTFSEKLASVRSVFIDTAPILYYIEAHPQFGPLAPANRTGFSVRKLASLFLDYHGC